MKQTIYIRFGSYYNLHVLSDKFAIDTIKESLKTYKMTKIRVKPKDPERSPFLKEVKKSISPYRLIANGFSIKAGLLDYVGIVIGEFARTYAYELDVSFPLNDGSCIELSSKWLAYLRQDQIEDMLRLIKEYSGIAALYTGYGKTTVLLAIADSLKGNVLILGNLNAVRDEIVKRAVLLKNEIGIEIDIGVEDWTKRINVINALGFSRRIDPENEAQISWLGKVNSVLTDECHHLSAASFDKIFDTLKNIKRAYGFSATPEAAFGKILSPSHVPFCDLKEENVKIIGYSGIVRIHKKSPVKLTIVKVVRRIAVKKTDEEVEKEKKEGVPWFEVLDATITSPRLADVIKEIFDKFPTIKFYIPIHKIESGKILYESLKNLGYNGIFWTGENFLPEELVIGKDYLQSVKAGMIRPEMRFLISSTVGYEAVDIKKLGGVIPLTGVNYRMTVQPSGRASRGDHLYAVLIYDLHNTMILSQCKKRRINLENEYENVKTVIM